MSTPTNGAARNAMSEFERQCYDWGWQDNEERIIKLISHELGVMKKAGGATFGRRKDYDEGYNTALRDITILIKEGEIL